MKILPLNINNKYRFNINFKQKEVIEGDDELSISSDAVDASGLTSGILGETSEEVENIDEKILFAQMSRIAHDVKVMLVDEMEKDDFGRPIEKRIIEKPIVMDEALEEEVLSNARKRIDVIA